MLHAHASSMRNLAPYVQRDVHSFATGATANGVATTMGGVIELEVGGRHLGAEFAWRLTAQRTRKDS